MRGLEEMRQVVRIDGIGYSVIRRSNEAVRRVVDMRQLFERNVALPVILFVPTFEREQGWDFRAAGNFSSQNVADIAVAVGIDKIQSWRGMITQPFLKLLPVPRVVDSIEALQFPAWLMGGPTHR